MLECESEYELFGNEDVMVGMHIKIWPMGKSPEESKINLGVSLIKKSNDFSITYKNYSKEMFKLIFEEAGDVFFHRFWEEYGKKEV
jgi:hypothetical protein